MDIDKLKGNVIKMDAIKADTIYDFVNEMIGAFESGFVDKNNPTLAQIHRIAQVYVKDNYDLDLPNIVEQWGSDLAQECGLVIKDLKT